MNNSERNIKLLFNIPRKYYPCEMRIMVFLGFRAVSKIFLHTYLHNVWSV